MLTYYTIVLISKVNAFTVTSPTKVLANKLFVIVQKRLEHLLKILVILLM